MQFDLAIREVAIVKIRPRVQRKQLLKIGFGEGWQIQSQKPIGLLRSDIVCRSKKNSIIVSPADNRAHVLRKAPFCQESRGCIG